MRLIIKVFYLVSALSVFLVGCAEGPRQAARHEYYRKITVDGRHDIVGRYPVDSTEVNEGWCYHVVYDRLERPIEIEYFTNGRLNADPEFNVPRIIIIYRGSWEVWRFYDEYGSPKENKDGVSGFRLKLNRKGYPVRKINFERDDMGVMEERRKLDKEGRRVFSRNIGKGGRLVYDLAGGRCYRWKYDEKGNLVETSCYEDRRGKHPYESINGVAIRRHKYDERGNLIEARFYDSDTHLVESKDKGVAITRRKYDDCGRLVEKSFFGKDGQPKEDYSGVARMYIEYSTDDAVREERYYGVDGELKGFTGIVVPIVRIERDSVQHVVVKKNLDAHGRLTGDGISGVALTRWVYDDDWKVQAMEFYGEDGLLRESAQYGFAAVRDKYDDEGRCIEIRYYGQDGKPKGIKIDTVNVAIMRYEYDSLGRRIKTYFYGTDGELVSSGPAILTQASDEEGNIVGLSVYVIDEESGKTKLLATICIEYNRFGEVRRMKVYDEEGKRVRTPGKFWIKLKFLWFRFRLLFM